MSGKRKILTFEEKKKIVENFKTSNQSKAAFAKAHGIARTTLNDILNSETIFENCENVKKKRQRPSCFEDVEKTLLIWVKYARTQNVPISCSILKEKALEIAAEMHQNDFKASNGWIERFKMRHNLSFKKITGEAADVDPEIPNEWKMTILNDLCQKYDPSNIFNLDECGLFYRLAPDKTLAFKDDKCIGGKKSKERLTILLGANMDGSEKLTPLVIGKFKKPRCFKRVSSLPVTYEANRKAWMTSEIWEKQMKQLDKYFTQKKRKVALVIDNCTAHCKVSNLQSIDLVFLPPNVTSVLQPLDQGVIRNFKVHYRKLLLKDLISSLDNHNSFHVSVLDAIFYVEKKWSMVTSQTIANCFRHAGFQKTSSEEITAEEDCDSEDDVPLFELAAQLRGRGYEFNDDYAVVDDGVSTNPEVTIVDIVSDLVNENIEMQTDESDEEIEEGPQVTYKDVTTALNVVRRFLVTCEKTEDKDFAVLTNLEKRVEVLKPKSKQTSIMDFFK